MIIQSEFFLRNFWLIAWNYNTNKEKKNYLAKILLAVWKKFSLENNFETLIPKIWAKNLLLSLTESFVNTNYKNQIGSLVTRNNLLFIDLRFNSKLNSINFYKEIILQLAFTCSKLTIGTAKQGVKYVQS